MLYTAQTRTSTDNTNVTKLNTMATKQVKVTFHSDLSTIEISRKLEAMFWDGEHFEDFEDVDWEIN